MKRKAHALVQDTKHADHVSFHAIHNDVRADGINAVRVGRFPVVWPLAGLPRMVSSAPMSLS